MHHVEFGAGQPLLVLHGGKLDHRHMVDALEPAFAGRSGVRRIYVDLPGHGRSPGDPAIRTMDDVLDRVAEFTRTIARGRRIRVLGESRGSHLARGLALTRPDLVAGVALIVPGGTSPGSDRPEHRTMVQDPETAARLPAEIRARFDQLVVQSPEIADRIARTKLPAVALCDAAQEARLRTAFSFGFEAETAPHRHDGPSLIVAGRQDAIAGFEDALAMRREFPHATVSVLDCAGHNLAWERPDLFRALVLDWLDRPG